MAGKVIIVLATYQGAEYVEALVESVRRQSYDDWTLLARDDGSTDGTAEILGRLAARDGRVRLLEGGGPRRGAAGNFGIVLQRACDLGADYVFPADQDDVWREDKIGKQLQRMERSEAATVGRRPQLVYSDLIVVDRGLRLIHPSFLRCSRLRRGGGRPLRTLLGRCFALGCASLANRPLLELALPLPASIASHDWWLALCAAAAGRIEFLPEPTLWYRRHGENSSGPAGFWAGFNPRRHSWRKRWETGYRSFRQSVCQASALQRRLEDRGVEATAETRRYLRRFCDVFARPQPAWLRIPQLVEMRIPAIDLPRRFLYYLCVGAMPAGDDGG
jgi:glycosyltransferase involved in cell wall biosynthesis